MVVLTTPVASEQIVNLPHRFSLRLMIVLGTSFECKTFPENAIFASKKNRKQISTKKEREKEPRQNFKKQYWDMNSGNICLYIIWNIW